MKNIRHRIGRLIVTLLFAAGTAMATSVPVSTASAEGPSLTDYDWQALYITKFGLNYVEWPEVTYSNEVKVINVCIFGDNPSFTKSLKTFQAKAAAKLKINIRNEDGSQVSGCNIAYIARNNPNYKDIIANVGNNPILTVAPINGFASSNGMVEFVISETKEGAGGAPFNSKVKVNFKVNNRVASANNLKIAPELLELSEEVIR